MLTNLLQRLKESEGDQNIFDPRSDSSVAFIVEWKNDLTRILLMRRSKREEDRWSGQLSFPGGHGEENESAVECALRECREEIGWSPEISHFVGELPSQQAISERCECFAVFSSSTPFLGWRVFHWIQKKFKRFSISKNRSFLTKIATFSMTIAIRDKIIAFLR